MDEVAKQIVDEAAVEKPVASTANVDEKTDGRKKPRTEAQKAATDKMLKSRKRKADLSAEASPSQIALADVWYSNHELAKDKRRKEKKTEMEGLIQTKLDSYHEKLMGELQKPISGFLDSFLTEYYDDKEETEPLVAEKESPVEKQRPNTESTSRKQRVAHIFDNKGKPATDWGRFF